MPYESHYVLCIFEDKNIITTQNYLSQSDLWQAIDLNSGHDYAGVEWIEFSEDCKIIWILKDNVSSTEDEDVDLIMHIYSYLFEADDEWRKNNV